MIVEVENGFWKICREEGDERSVLGVAEIFICIHLQLRGEDLR